MQQTFWEHLDDLRSILIRSVFTLIIGIFLSLFFYEKIFYVLTSPLKASKNLSEQTIQRKRITNTSTTPKEYSLYDQRLINFSSGVHIADHGKIVLSPDASIDVDIPIDDRQLVVLSPLEGMMVTFKVCFWMGLVLSSPFWLYFFIGYLLPALTEQERSLIAPFILLSFLFISAGFLFAYYITIPFANEYLNSFNSVFATNLWSLANYINYTLFLLVANGVAFEIGAILFLLVHYRLISAEDMREKRRYVILVAFILGALLTPPDVLTQLLMAVPLIILYEIAILYAALRSNKKIEEYTYHGR